MQALWIGIDVPVTATGRFSGTYEVRATGVPPISVAVALDVCGEPADERLAG